MRLTWVRPSGPAPVAWLGMALVTLAGCAPAAEEDAVPGEPAPLVRLLADGNAIFGIFSGEHTAEQGEAMASNRETDFVFYSLESGPFDLETMDAYRGAMAAASGDAPPHPFALRVPPIRDGADAARDHVRQALGRGVDAIVFPHVESGDDAALAVEVMGDELWPGNPAGRLLNMLIIEDQAGVSSAMDIVATPGVSVVFAGPGDLRRAYDGDMVAVEEAIQTVLTACQMHSVPCGITAGVDDIAERLEQGFRVIIVTRPDALAVGKTAAGRDG